MEQNLHSSASTIPGDPTRFLSISWDYVGLHEVALLSLSLFLLILSTLDPGPFGSIVKVSWLVSFAVLTAVNIGGALAVYIGSLAIYSSLLFPGGSSSILQRPDNLAVVIFFVAMTLQVLKSREKWSDLVRYIVGFLGFCFLHLILFSPTQFPALIRDLVIPLVACALSAIIGYREKELDALFKGLAILGAYMGLVSVLERIPGATNFVLPPWIADPSLRPHDEFLDGWIGSGRSGGTLLQAAFNGLLLTLIFMILLLRLQKNNSMLLKVSMALCLAGSFFTYTRGVWLGLIVALLCFPGWCKSSRQANIRRITFAIFAVAFLIAAKGFASERLQDEGTVLYRLNLWGAGFRIFLSHPVLGVGFFNFGNALGTTQQGFGSLFPNFRDVEEGVASHNTLLTVLVEFGLVGFAAFAMTIRKIIRGAQENADRLIGSSGKVWVLAFVLLFLTNAQFISAFEGTTNTVLFAFLGVLAGSKATPFGHSCA